MNSFQETVSDFCHFLYLICKKKIALTQNVNTHEDLPKAIHSQSGTFFEDRTERENWH